MNQTFEIVFHHISKHVEFRQKYSAARRIFNSFLSVWKCDTLPLVFDVLRLIGVTSNGNDNDNILPSVLQV